MPSGKAARASTRGRSWRGIGGSTGKSRRSAVRQTTSIMDTAMTRPGMTPARNSAAIDAFAISA